MMRSLIAIAAFALFSSLGWANDRPDGIPEEARTAITAVFLQTYFFQIGF